MFSNLYLHRGTFFAISSDPSRIPSVSHILSNRAAGVVDPDNIDPNPPAGDESRWQTITPARASEMWGPDRAVASLGGTTVRAAVRGGWDEG